MKHSIIAGLMCAGLAAAAPARLTAATITVNATADVLDGGDDQCTLREAVIAANGDAASGDLGLHPLECAAGSGADTIVVPAGEYVLSLASTNENAALDGDLDIASDVTIQGAGAASSVINGNGAVTGDRVFNVIINTSVSLSGLTIENGKVGSFVDGGGIFVGSNSTLEMSDCVVSSNLSDQGNGGGIVNFGSLAVRRSAFVGNSGGFGGAIDNLGDLLIVGGTFSGNSASYAGGALMANGSSADVLNATLSGNSTQGDGGAVFVNTGSIINLRHATITENTTHGGDGGGVRIQPAAALHMEGTLLADNIDDAGEAPDCSGVLDSLDHNLIQSALGCTVTGSTAHDLTGVSASLSPLADNGGPTKTHALQAASPAIDAGDPAACVGDLALDQRGVARYGACDIGAFEFAGSCGDGVHQASAGEACDDGNAVDGDGCEADCTNPACGNAILDSGEQCDDGNADDSDACANDCTENVPGATGGGTTGGESTGGGTTGGSTTGAEAEGATGGCSLVPSHLSRP